MKLPRKSWKLHWLSWVVCAFVLWAGIVAINTPRTTGFIYSLARVDVIYGFPMTCARVSTYNDPVALLRMGWDEPLSVDWIAAAIDTLVCGAIVLLCTMQTERMLRNPKQFTIATLLMIALALGVAITILRGLDDRYFGAPVSFYAMTIAAIYGTFALPVAARRLAPKS